MTKTELIDKLSEKTGVSKKDSTALLDAFVQTATQALKEGDSIKLAGFGTFSVRTRAARKSFNPQTREMMDVPEKQYVAFKSSSVLKDIS